MLLRSTLAALALLTPLHSAPLQNGDRIALLGDAIFETERHTAGLEFELHQRFPNTQLSLRNISWSGDTPAGFSRASFDPASKGIDRLREHLTLADPSVVILNYGMASTLQEITDHSQDWTLNPDPKRYGTTNVERFEKELDALLKLIKEVAGADTRIIIITPIPHEDIRNARPGLPNPTAHNALLDSYTQAISKVANTHDATQVDSKTLLREIPGPKTSNGIHLTQNAYRAYVANLCDTLGWKSNNTKSNPALRQAILAKSDAFFHRYRPANSTYLFGFRKHEQGQNAKEMAAWDKVIAERDQIIHDIKNGNAPPDGLADPEPDIVTPPLSEPTFTVPDGYEITLWADAPQVRKPVAMNWDHGGQLWVASTPIYPQIQPGKFPEDKIYVLADKDGDGKAESSTIFADKLLIPTGIVPVHTQQGTPARSCYVGASTDILLLTDKDGDGKSDSRQVILTGFGTEDTHHNVHTLRWGPDERLYFHQSIYIHSHLETPHGMIRLNSGAVASYDPKTERVEVFSKGLVNSWGHSWDKDGQSFQTDGAGFQGLAWMFPGATLNAYENAERSMPTISPGSYPKYAGLELVDSNLFPEDWQGLAITGDFRAHRVVRFRIEDLSKQNPPRSGYVTQELEPLVVTSDVAFRPIDIKHGFDGALYIADWTNPIIQHGEVDFRDPRRDQANGRIWRVAPKDANPIQWSPTKRPIARSTDPVKDATSNSPRRRVEGMRALAKNPTPENATHIIKAAANKPKDDPYYDFAAWRSLRDVAPAWMNAVTSGSWDPADENNALQITTALDNLPPNLATETLRTILTQSKPDLTKEGPWHLWIGNHGDANMAKALFDTTESGSHSTHINALLLAAKRNVIPPDLKKANAAFFTPTTPEGLHLIGAWKLNLTNVLEANLRGPNELRNAAFSSLGQLRTPEAIAVLNKYLTAEEPHLRHHSLATLASFRADLAVKALPPIATELGKNASFWDPLLAHHGFLQVFPKNIPSDWDIAIYKAALEAARKRGRPGTNLVKALQPLAGEDPNTTAGNNMTVARILNAAKQGGDPARGEMVYRKPELACTLCHAIGGVGGKLGPDMTSLGASAPVDYIVESLVHPDRKVKEGYHAVVYTLTDGNSIIGIPFRATDKDQFIRTAAGEQAIPRDTIKSQAPAGAGGSLMPAGLINSLDYLEVRSLVHFLQQLGKPGPYDASNGSIARLWKLHPADEKEFAHVDEATPGGTPLATLIDGRVTPAIIKPLLGNQEFILAQTQFVTTQAGEANLKLEGIREAWLNREALPVASEPGRKVTLPAGTHTLTIRLDANGLPPHFRASCPEGRFLTE